MNCANCKYYIPFAKGCCCKLFPKRCAYERKKKKGWLEGYNEKECKTECEKALKILFKLEDNTNYEIKELGEVITILMMIDFAKQFQKKKKEETKTIKEFKQKQRKLNKKEMI